MVGVCIVVGTVSGVASSVPCHAEVVDRVNSLGFGSRDMNSRVILAARFQVSHGSIRKELKISLTMKIIPW